MPLSIFQSPLYLFTYAVILLLHLNKPKQEPVKQILRCLKIWQKIYRSPLAQRWSTSRLVHWCNSGGNLEKGPRHLSPCTDRHRVLQEKVEKRSLSVPSPSLPWTVSLFSPLLSNPSLPTFCNSAQCQLPRPMIDSVLRALQLLLQVLIKKNKAYPNLSSCLLHI